MTLIACKLNTGDDIWINPSLVRSIQVTEPNKECKLWFAFDDHWIIAEAAQTLAWRLHKAEQR